MDFNLDEILNKIDTVDATMQAHFNMDDEVGPKSDTINHTPVRDYKRYGNKCTNNISRFVCNIAIIFKAPLMFLMKGSGSQPDGSDSNYVYFTNEGGPEFKNFIKKALKTYGDNCVKNGVEGALKAFELDPDAFVKMLPEKKD